MPGPPRPPEIARNGLPALAVPRAALEGRWKAVGCSAEAPSCLRPLRSRSAIDSARVEQSAGLVEVPAQRPADSTRLGKSRYVLIEPAHGSKPSPRDALPLRIGARRGGRLGRAAAPPSGLAGAARLQVARAAARSSVDPHPNLAPVELYDHVLTSFIEKNKLLIDLLVSGPSNLHGPQQGTARAAGSGSLTGPAHKAPERALGGMARSGRLATCPSAGFS